MLHASLSISHNFSANIYAPRLLRITFLPRPTNRRSFSNRSLFRICLRFLYNEKRRIGKLLYFDLSDNFDPYAALKRQTAN